MIKFFNKYRKRFESNDKDFKYFIPNILLTPSELCGLDPGSQKSIADPDIGIKKHRIPDPPHWIWDVVAMKAQYPESPGKVAAWDYNPYIG